MPELSARVVVVTGGSAGIGRATVERLVLGGARVVTCARDGDRLADAVGALPGVTSVTADVA
ncbi:SDR family NAD(P)-dependent oxidoreductase [Blastococcus sp. TML/M2B]|nr:SDR family NAD(P)-dependent oxidoreductase [Blastococcus sp. TML/M2B]